MHMPLGGFFWDAVKVYVLFYGGLLLAALVGLGGLGYLVWYLI